MFNQDFDPYDLLEELTHTVQHQGELLRQLIESHEQVCRALEHHANHHSKQVARLDRIKTDIQNLNDRLTKQERK